MDFNEAYALFRETYSSAGVNVTEQGRELIISIEGHNIRIAEEDISTYADQYDSFKQLRITPCECAICSPSYREQMIEPIDAGPLGGLHLSRTKGVTFGQEGGQLYAEIGTATDLFKNRLRFEEAYLVPSITMLRRRLHFREGVEEKSDLRDHMLFPHTIRVSNIGASSVEEALEISTQVIEGCLFELSYLKGIGMGLSEGWSFRLPRVRQFRYQDLVRENELPLPSVTFNSDIVRFYQRGVSTRDPVIQFLSFYQVLEYFFLSVSDERLYEKLSHRLNDPRFAPRPRHLDRIIQDIHEHKRVSDETEMLKLVLEKYVESDGLIGFIGAYESHLDEKYYTKRRQLFGKDVPEVKLQEGHLHGNIAKRIKVIRNAIVHSSDRYERHERYVPFGAHSEKIISREVPLMQYLAERVIISSAT